MALLTLREIKQSTADAPCAAAVHVQVERAQVKPTKSGSEYLELKLADAGDHLVLRVWGDTPVFAAARALPSGAFIAVEGEWSSGTYGLEPRNWSFRLLEDGERTALLGGPPEMREKQTRDYADITALTESIMDPRLRGLCRMFLEEFGERFRRTGAAREYHHARRGGLVEHVAQMMRAAVALTEVYPGTNRDLLVAGVLFHDCGKLWENCYDRDGFSMPHTEVGELMGHIPMGIELVNRLWRKLMESDEAADWKESLPGSESVRLHLLHLIGAHHGEYQFGSPVLPRTPEAILLHHVDNIDAKLEMFSEAYATSALLAPNVFERRRPLPGNPVRPLALYETAGEAPEQDGGGADADGEVGEKPAE
jgi:3'-5' exoribonuclease